VIEALVKVAEAAIESNIISTRPILLVRLATCSFFIDIIIIDVSVIIDVLNPSPYA